MLNIVTVQKGNYLGLGREYVEKLYAGVDRWLPRIIKWKAVCFTDNPKLLPNFVEPKPIPEGVEGWWAKLSMFQPGAFKPGERCLYFDLDTIITGNLWSFATYDGPFAGLRDMYYKDHLNSAVMGWKAGSVDDIWTLWDQSGRPQFEPHGDQLWIETVHPNAVRWQDKFPGQVVSYKADCRDKGEMPDGTRILLFHGLPRPHECEDEWVKQLWTSNEKELV